MSALAAVPLEQSLAVLNYTLRNVCNMRISSKQVQRLYDKCVETAEDLQQIDPYLLRSHRACALIETITRCLAWCCAYERKWALMRFLCSAAYRERFQRLHSQLTEDFTGFTQSIQLTKPLAEWHRVMNAPPTQDLLVFPPSHETGPPDSTTTTATTLELLRDIVVVTPDVHSKNSIS